MRQAPFFMIFFLILGILMTACISPASKSPQVTPAPVMTTVKVAYQPTIANGPLYFAKEEGYFAQQGIKVEFEKTQSTMAALPLLISGDIAVSTGPLKMGLINSVANGAHVRIVADKGRVTQGFCTAYALMVRKDLFDKGIVRNVSDLKGRKISGPDQDYELFRALALSNLSSDDVETVNMDFPSSVLALKNGAVDASLLTEPYITQTLDSSSAVVLVPAQDFMPNWPLPLYFGPSILDKNPELGNRFMVAYLQGVKQYNEGKTERNLEILQNYTKLDRNLLNQSCWYPITADGNLPWQPVREYIDWMYANKKITHKLDEDQLFDMSYVNYANGVLHNTTSGRSQST